ncbi:integrase core domain-containing protein, partial [Corynebacterium sp. MSK195]|uniref:integrase core domain-containing protein n=1 Tax=Corynebacterium sp. MSK195 TaxID=3050216 RepID=UPI002549FA5D
MVVDYLSSQPNRAGYQVSTKQGSGPPAHQHRAVKEAELNPGRFITDVYSRRIVGWALSDSMRTEALPLQALNQAIASAEETTGLIHHSDHGSQYVSVVYNERLAQHGIAASTGTVGDSYDNALAENVNGSYKNELIHTRRWDEVVEVEIATFEWVSWWNETRLHQSLGYRTPVEVETEFWDQHPPQAIIEIKANA